MQADMAHPRAECKVLELALSAPPECAEKPSNPDDGCHSIPPPFEFISGSAPIPSPQFIVIGPPKLKSIPEPDGFMEAMMACMIAGSAYDSVGSCEKSGVELG